MVLGGYCMAMKMGWRWYGEGNDHSMDARRWIGYNLYCLGKKEESLRVLEEIYPKYVERYGENASNTVMLLRWITGIRKELPQE